MNFAKSYIYFSNNENHAHQQEMSLGFGVTLTPNLGMYLGVSLFYERCFATKLQFILYRMSSRLNGWKMNLLAFGGKITLTLISII